jgi:hypothetical protein
VKERSKAAAYVERDWSFFESSLIEHWKRLAAEGGASSIWAIGDELRRHAMQQNPEWPTARDRARDRESHLKVMEILARVPARGR